jgi:hypothetical protein
MTADLAEEHSTSTLATERLEAETADRLRLEKELQDVQVRQISECHDTPVHVALSLFIFTSKYVCHYRLFYVLGIHFDSYSIDSHHRLHYHSAACRKMDILYSGCPH